MSSNVRTTFDPLLIMDKNRQVIHCKRMWVSPREVFLIDDDGTSLYMGKDDFLFFCKRSEARYFTVYSEDGTPEEYSVLTGARTLSRQQSKEKVRITEGETAPEIPCLDEGPVRVLEGTSDAIPAGETDHHPEGTAEADPAESASAECGDTRADASAHGFPSGNVRGVGKRFVKDGEVFGATAYLVTDTIPLPSLDEFDKRNPEITVYDLGPGGTMVPRVIRRDRIKMGRLSLGITTETDPVTGRPRRVVGEKVGFSLMRDTHHV